MKKIYTCDSYYYRFEVVESNNNFKIWHKNEVLFINKKEFINIFKNPKNNKDIHIMHLIKTIKLAYEFKTSKEVFNKLVNFFKINSYSQQCLLNESLKYMPIN